MTRRHHGYALLGAVVALIVALSATLYAVVAADDGTPTATTVPGGGPHGASAAPVSAGTWVGSWAAAPVGGEPGTGRTGLAGRSVRNVVHTSMSGTRARVTLSNLYGQSALTLTHASVALAAGRGTAAADAATMRRLTFGGAVSVVIPAGGQAVSDAVALRVPRGADLLVTTYSPTASGPVTYHPRARQISYTAAGDRTEDAGGGAYTGQTPYWRYVTALDVLSDDSDGTLVAFGDSLTDGVTSTTGANRRWPDVLAGRLRGSGGVPRYGVVNEGISGNQVLADGLGRPAENERGVGRFSRDVLGRPDVRVVVVDLGINDILRNPGLADADAVTGGLRALVRSAHAHGIRVVGATLMPFRGHRGWTPARERVRQEINERIRSGRVYDAVTDFDKALRDPYAPDRLRPYYDSGDHLHPNNQGFTKMATTLNLPDLTAGSSAAL
ncbi:SGNH/GDSL hydrolase family protein [Streptomyces arenae]|uniref:SGNH/GDSL hydrolase family protein n=1 Tax=Streptomyces arenae TaxID=29301 RepID=UPI00265A4938|nr:SGNH/GDSL hydrolase family protein [Streptomyces arenae]MCG7206979.1 SGNH/GDSL hydrolase family protein [Streptomyces arenae]